VPAIPHCLRDILSKSSAYLEQRKVDSPRLSAELVLAHALGVERLDLYLDLDRPLTEQDLSKIRSLLARRGIGEPMAYILGRKEFYGLEFIVTKDVLIPRPETELCVDAILKLYQLDQPVLCADVATGSGAIAVTLLVHLPVARCLATDISRPALTVAAKNCVAHGVQDRALLTQSDLLSHLSPASLDLVLANPPYLAESEFLQISKEVADFEPRIALVAGPRGDEYFWPLVEQAMIVLKPGGHLLLETGPAQAEKLAGGIRSCSSRWSDVRVLKDYAGLNRYVQACWS
jgi:release factor glutamine methyltransferase